MFQHENNKFAFSLAFLSYLYMIVVKIKQVLMPVVRLLFTLVNTLLNNGGATKQSANGLSYNKEFSLLALAVCVIIALSGALVLSEEGVEFDTIFNFEDIAGQELNFMVADDHEAEGLNPLLAVPETVNDMAINVISASDSVGNKIVPIKNGQTVDTEEPIDNPVEGIKGCVFELENSVVATTGTHHSVNNFNTCILQGENSLPISSIMECTNLGNTRCVAEISRAGGVQYV